MTHASFEMARTPARAPHHCFTGGQASLAHSLDRPGAWGSRTSWEREVTVEIPTPTMCRSEPEWLPYGPNIKLSVGGL